MNGESVGTLLGAVSEAGLRFTGECIGVTRKLLRGKLCAWRVSR